MGFFSFLLLEHRIFSCRRRSQNITGYSLRESGRTLQVCGSSPQGWVPQEVFSLRLVSTETPAIGQVHFSLPTPARAPTDSTCAFLLEYIVISVSAGLNRGTAVFPVTAVIFGIEEESVGLFSFFLVRMERRLPVCYTLGQTHKYPVTLLISSFWKDKITDTMVLLWVWILVFPQISYAEILHHRKVMVLGGEALGRCLSHEGGALLNGISALWEAAERPMAPSTMLRTQRTSAPQGEPWPHHAGTVVSNIQSPRLWELIMLCISYPVCENFLQQSEQTKPHFIISSGDMQPYTKQENTV